MPTSTVHRRVKPPQPLTRSLELRRNRGRNRHGQNHAGDELDETELAARFHVSGTPIREALIQLASTGFVEMRPRRGAVVPELAPQRLVEMFELMAETRGQCAGGWRRGGCQRPTTSRLVQAHEACQALSSKHDPDGYYHENRGLSPRHLRSEPQLIPGGAGVGTCTDGSVRTAGCNCACRDRMATSTAGAQRTSSRRSWRGTARRLPRCCASTCWSARGSSPTSMASLGRLSATAGGTLPGQDKAPPDGERGNHRVHKSEVTGVLRNGRAGLEPQDPPDMERSSCHVSGLLTC